MMATDLMKRQQEAARDLAETQMIIWDEISMLPKAALEEVDNLLGDVLQKDTPFGSSAACRRIMASIPPSSWEWLYQRR